MHRHHLFLFALLLLSPALAGCAEPSATDEGAGGHSGDGTHAGTDGTGTDGMGDDGAAEGDAPASDGTGDAEADEWAAFDFTREVTTADGHRGHIASFDYRHTQTEGEESTILDVHVEVLGTRVEEIRASKMWLADGEFQTETVSTPLEVQLMRHTVTVVQDDTGDQEVGDVTTVTYFRIVDPVLAEHGFNGYFAKAATESAEGTGSVEYYVTPEMEAAAEAEDATYTIYAEGDTGDWWGAAHLLGIYGSGMWYDYVQGAEYEQGEWSYGGTSTSMNRETLEVSGHAFDGWSYAMDSVTGESSAAYAFQVAPGLPMPFTYRIQSESQYSSSLLLYELKALELA